MRRNARNKQTKKRPNAKRTRVTAPLAVSARTRNQQPQWRANKNGTVTIKHREQFTEVYRPDATQDYANIFGLRINPANSAVFPWLAGISPSWESYTFESLQFEYVPSAPSTAPGTVVMGVDYDPTDLLPVNKRDLMQMEGSTSAGLWVPQTHRSTRANLTKRKELFTAAEGDGNRLNDVGNLVIGIFGTEDDYSFASTGDLWVSYEVRLHTPQPRDFPTSDLVLYAQWTAAAGDPATDFARNNLFASIAGGDLALTESLQGQAAYPTPAGLTFPQPGNYYVTIRMFAGPARNAGGNILSNEAGGVIITPVNVVGQASGVITAEERTKPITPGFNLGITGDAFFQHDIALTTSAPYTSFAYNAAAITAICGVLYCRVQRNAFLDTVSTTPLLPS